MGTPIETKEAVKQAHISQIKAHFVEPGQTGWTEEAIKQLDKLYSVALTEDPDDPVTWIVAFNRSHPINLQIGNANTRLEKILIMTDLYQNQRKQRAEQLKKKRFQGF